MSALPTFSIIVPTYRRPERLRSCLEALTALDYPRERFEVIVVEDGSGIPIHHSITGVEETIDVRLVRQAHAGPATARNTGATHARGDYLAFTDDDCMPEAGWLRALAGRVTQAPGHVIGGRIVNVLPNNPYSSATQTLTDFLYAWHADRRRDGFFVSSNLAVDADLFRKRDGFHLAFRLAGGEDREFCHRWAMAGGRMTYAPEAVVRHAHPLTLRSFWQQHSTYGRGAFLFYRLRSEDRQLNSTPLSFYLKLVTYPLLHATGWRRLSLTVLLAFAQAATAAGYWREWRLQQEACPREKMTRLNRPNRTTRSHPHRR